MGAEAAAAAVLLVERYYVPMAERVYADADEPQERRNARTLARWILGQGAATAADGGTLVVNVREIRERARVPGLRKTADIEAAIHYLALCGWASGLDWTGAVGRPRNDWIINRKVFDRQH